MVAVHHVGDVQPRSLHPPATPCRLAMNSTLWNWPAALMASISRGPRRHQASKASRAVNQAAYLRVRGRQQHLTRHSTPPTGCPRQLALDNRAATGDENPHCHVHQVQGVRPGQFGPPALAAGSRAPPLSISTAADFLNLHLLPPPAPATAATAASAGRPPGHHLG